MKKQRLFAGAALTAERIMQSLKAVFVRVLNGYQVVVAAQARCVTKDQDAMSVDIQEKGGRQCGNR